MNNLTAGNPGAHAIRVYYEGSDTIYEGMALCYNQDTTSNWFGGSVSNGEVTASGTTAEGSQNEGKYIRVEKPATANLPFFAGVVKKGGWIGKSGPRVVDIYVPNGAIVPVRGTESFTIGEKIYLANADYEFTNVPQAGGECGIAMETVDRSSTEGLLLAVLKQPKIDGGSLVKVATYTQDSSPVTVTAAMHGTVFDNTGATGAVEFDLPAAANAKGCEYTFSCATNQNIAIDPNGTEVILFGNDADALAAGEALTLTPADANDKGLSIVLVSNGTAWVVKSFSAQAIAKMVIPA